MPHIKRSVTSHFSTGYSCTGDENSAPSTSRNQGTTKRRNHPQRGGTIRSYSAKRSLRNSPKRCSRPTSALTGKAAAVCCLRKHTHTSRLRDEETIFFFSERLGKERDDVGTSSRLDPHRADQRRTKVSLSRDPNLCQALSIRRRTAEQNPGLRSFLATAQREKEKPAGFANGTQLVNSVDP